MLTVYRGLLIGVPISLALWAVLLLPVAAEAERHPHALARLESLAQRHLGFTG